MAISRHMQVLLTSSGPASILTQKTAMSLACLNCRICFPFMLPYFFLLVQDGFTMDSIFVTICLLYHSCLVLCILTNLFSLFAF